MNRRGFLKALVAAAVLPELGRVYSFPTKIVVADNRAILRMWTTASEWKSTEVIRPLKEVTYVFAKGVIFVANLNQLDVAQCTEFDSIVSAYHPSTSAIAFWDGPSLADPVGLVATTELDPVNNVVSRARRLCPPLSSLVTST
jgi:hypothetical protein